MIPKKIHYCWFGGKELSEDAKKYIASWKKYCPDYKIIRWDETNFNVNSNEYTKEAYAAKKWAFVTDYVRLYVLYKEGGIYMDTDVEVLRSLDPFLNNESFSGFESETNIPTGIMGAEKGNRLFGEFLNYYNEKHFLRNNGTYDTTTNVEIITNYCKKNGLKQNNTKQTIDGFTIYPKDFFCPKNFNTGIIELTKNTVTIHHFSGSWLPQIYRRRDAFRRKLCDRFGAKAGTRLFKTVFYPYDFVVNVIGYVQRNWKRSKK